MSKIRVPNPFSELVKEVNLEKVVVLFGKYHETEHSRWHGGAAPTTSNLFW